MPSGYGVCCPYGDETPLGTGLAWRLPRQSKISNKAITIVNKINRIYPKLKSSDWETGHEGPGHVLPGG